MTCCGRVSRNDAPPGDEKNHQFESSLTKRRAGIAKWSAVTDSEQLSLVAEFARGNISYAQFASRRLEIDTRYRGEITRAVVADYKNSGNGQQNKNNALPKATADPSSSCGWEGTQWVCRSL